VGDHTCTIPPALSGASHDSFEKYPTTTTSSSICAPDEHPHHCANDFVHAPVGQTHRVRSWLVVASGCCLLTFISSSSDWPFRALTLALVRFLTHLTMASVARCPV
jgi:hypothetical protein